jgi:hypothetical protein
MNTATLRAFLMSSFVVLSVSFTGLNSPASANDTGDNACQVFALNVVKIESGTYGSFVDAGIVVKKSLLTNGFVSTQVGMAYKDALGNWKNSVATKQFEQNDNVYYSAQFSYGSLGGTAPLEMVAYLARGTDRLFDNNQAGNITLS